jgi:hypothetical protein
MDAHGFVMVKAEPLPEGTPIVEGYDFNKVLATATSPPLHRHKRGPVRAIHGEGGGEGLNRLLLLLPHT